MGKMKFRTATIFIFLFFFSAFTSAQTKIAGKQPGMLFGDTTRTGLPFSKDPYVIRFHNRYLMYYSIPPYKDRSNPVQGWGIGIAESSDLYNWKHKGEINPDGDYEKKGLAAPCALVINDQVHLFYQTYGNGRNDAACHAVSDDGIHFKRDQTNPIFHPTGSWNCGRAIDVEVCRFKDKYFLFFATRDSAFKIQIQGVEAAAVVQRGDLLYMFYAGAYNNKPQQIGVAKSADGVNWTKLSNKPFLANGDPGEWNYSESGHPHLFTDKDGKTYLFFQANNDNGKTYSLSNVEVRWNENGPYLVK
jgi:beta-1,2-mannobiose phosphorylase / 1,2-beta-oligomannan phosphorylase